MKLMNLNQTQTMSSREMSSLTGVRHDSVMRTIKSLIDNNILLATICGQYKDSTGRELNCYNSDKRDSLVIVARLSPEFTGAVIDRWQELESNQQLSLPTTYLDALKELVSKEEINQQLQLENKQKENKLIMLAHTEKTYITSELAKELGITAVKLNKILEHFDIQSKKNGTWLLKSPYHNQGFSETKQDILQNGKVIYITKWSQKGREFVLNLYKTELDKLMSLQSK